MEIRSRVPDAETVFVAKEAGSVPSGIGMALTLLGRIAGADHARAVQPATEYDPQPPYDSGSPRKAPAHIGDALGARSRFILTQST